MLIYIIIGLVALYLAASFVENGSNILKAKKVELEIAQNKLKEEYKDKLDKAYSDKVIAIQTDYENKFDEHKKETFEAIGFLLNEKTSGFPWLANAIADYFENYDLIFAKHLITKPHPAFNQAERIKEIAKEKKLFKKEFLTTKYIIKYYEALFPWLPEYVGFNSDELIRSIYKEDSQDTEEKDPVAFYITPSEFENLSVTERNQRALDRYWKRDKDLWQIGRDYERYIGYLYEESGFKVYYHGIEKGKEDLGRDLICIKGNHIEIVQCKYWSAQKGIPIRENHVTQLYGTTIKYFLDNKKDGGKVQLELFAETIRQNKIHPVMAVTTELSETAKEFANVLGIRVDKIYMDNEYPCIKCNINFQTGERIYHLPFDQQYDKTMIDPKKGECWVHTVEEAENLGFRRAWRWRGTNNES